MSSFFSSLFSCCAARKTKIYTPSSSRGTSILFPLYIYPDAGCWDRIFTVIHRHPEQHFTLVMNPNSGPGAEKYPDAEYTDAIAKLNLYRNVTLIGYVYTTYGTRNLTKVIGDVQRFAAWATHAEVDIHVDGIFVDEAPGELGEAKMHLDYMKRLHEAIKSAFRGVQSPGYMITNPGKIVEKAFYDYADSIVSYEAAFATMAFPDTLFTSKDGKMSAGMPASRHAALIHSFDGTKRKQSDLVQTLVKKGLGEVYITTSNPSKGEGDYNKFSELWEDFASEMERANVAARYQDP